jgi:ABC-type sulfate transport system permease component
MLLNVLIASAASAAIALVMGAYLRWLHRRYVTPLDYPNKELAGEILQTSVIRIY